MREHIHISFWADADKLWHSVNYSEVGPVLIGILQKVRELHSYIDPLLVQTVHNLTQRYCDDERFLEAEALYTELIAALRTVHDDDHPLVVDTMRGMQHVQHLFLAQLADINEDRVAVTPIATPTPQATFMRSRVRKTA